MDTVVNKRTVLQNYIKSHEHLPAQRSPQWLLNRKFRVGGSDISTVAGMNPYKGKKEFVEGHLGITSFSGNINTYWGTIMEDYITIIIQDNWGCDIHELGSLPGVIKNQNYSPDGLLYLECIDAIILLEIKNPCRRVPTGRVPTQYKPQLFTGLDTIQIADFVLFVDVMARRCSPKQFAFTPDYDHELHGNKPVKHDPMSLSIVTFHIDKNNTAMRKICDTLKDECGRSIDEWIDLGSCTVSDLSTILKFAASGDINFDFSDPHDTPISYLEITNQVEKKYEGSDNTIVGIMPLKIFKFMMTPVQRHDWKSMRKYKNEPGDSYVGIYEKEINEVIDIIRLLDPFTQDEQIKKLECLFPSKIEKKISSQTEEDLINSLLM
jgi:hypothetical protein